MKTKDALLDLFNNLPSNANYVLGALYYNLYSGQLEDIQIGLTGSADLHELPPDIQNLAFKAGKKYILSPNAINAFVNHNDFRDVMEDTMERELLEESGLMVETHNYDIALYNSTLVIKELFNINDLIVSNNTARSKLHSLNMTNPIGLKNVKSTMLIYSNTYDDMFRKLERTCNSLGDIFTHSLRRDHILSLVIIPRTAASDHLEKFKN